MKRFFGLVFICLLNFALPAADPVQRDNNIPAGAIRIYAANQAEVIATLCAHVQSDFDLFDANLPEPLNAYTLRLKIVVNGALPVYDVLAERDENKVIRVSFPGYN